MLVTNPASCVNNVCVSNTAQLQVTAPPPAPVLTAIAPTTTAAGGGSFTLTALGQSFAPNSVVRVNGSARETVYDSPGQLRATILADDVGSSGSLSITVWTPAPGGGTSAQQTLQVTGPGLSAAPPTGPPDLEVVSTVGVHTAGRGDPTTIVTGQEVWRAARTPDGPGTVSWHGAGHLAAGGIGFLCVIAATWVLARHLPRGWAAYSRISGTLFLAGFAGIASGNQAPALTLGFVAAVVVIFAWLAAVSIRLYRSLACT